MTQGKQFINETLTKIQDTTGNPAPLGFIGIRYDYRPIKHQ